MSLQKIPEFQTSSFLADDNPFVGPRTQPTRKISVKLLTDEWLCHEMEKPNLTIVENYPSRNSEARVSLGTSLLRYPSHKIDGTTSTLSSKALLVPLSHTGTMNRAKLNSAYSRIARLTTSYQAYLPRHPKEVGEVGQRVLLHL